MTDKKTGEWPNLEADPIKEDKTKTTDNAAGDNTGDKADLTAQFQELGQRLVSTARTAWQSEQRQELQQEVTNGLRTVRDQLNEALDNVRTTARSQGVSDTVKEQVHKAAETARSNDLLDELRSGLVGGLRELNEQLRRLSERLERRDDTATTGTTSASAAGTTSESVDVTPAPATATEVDQLLAAGGSAPTVVPSAEIAPERKGDLPTQPEGPSPVEKV